MAKRIVITGIGILAPNGIGKEAFWDALKNGLSGIKKVSLFNIDNLRTSLAGEIADFNPEAILGVKGLRNLDRSTKLALAASRLALDDAGIKHPLTEEETDLFGVSLGSTMGSVWSISEFDKEALREGPRSVNPALFPNTVINSPASHISIVFNIQGFNSTISTGFCSSLDAIYYAMNMMTLYDYKVVLAGGVEELCEQTYKGFYKVGHLAGSRPGKEEVNCPFDKRRNGIVLGEGSCVAVLEELEHAGKRGARIYAEILGYGASFDPASKNRYSPKAKGAEEAIRLCLEDARLNADDIGYVSASANSTLDCDAMETTAIKNVFGDCAKAPPVSSIKSMVGESFSNSGAFNLASGIGVLAEGFIPPTINYEKPDRRCDLDCVPNEARRKKVENILINSFSPTGSNSALAIGRYAEG
ncbi:MAG: beta-ketoacyl-[acyl-carrier-protein] synthase family protein [Candidatus Omnitrophota bacterium]|nr:beta-ketoacyl-[acyl-carrier-protein] synthase family protein [Candidatus Omnitrophota bacterium]